MAETSRPRVTITLGRGGQVVEKAGFVSDGDAYDSMPPVGRKRSVRDRLGSSVDDSVVHGSHLNNKRLRGYNNGASVNINGVNGLHIGKDDLRFKLMQKTMFKQTESKDQHNSMDLREKLSRTVFPPLTSIDMQQHIPQRKDISLLGRGPPTKIANYLPQIEPMRNSYSAWTLERIRRRSPERILSSSRGLSPQRNAEELQKRIMVSSFDDVRSVPYSTKYAVDPLRPVVAASLVTKPTLPTGSVKPAGPLLPQLPSPGSVGQKSSYTGNEHASVDILLRSLGLEKYAIFFKAEEVDMTALKQMGDNDLKELGIPMVYPFKAIFTFSFDFEYVLTFLFALFSLSLPLFFKGCDAL
ncbi:uncharacterized protein LOC131144144 isoform X2 [Malania oleifera]|uniref:uncharacterized protein LOC131144144 isoform X2 n=1 Tax=Malania oleifera TaxID=397392 RepID=UPI0025AEC3BF|nr:uncharacterized protein LOC131144144 isoform X2 [Malania oleifera]